MRYLATTLALAFAAAPLLAQDHAVPRGGGSSGGGSSSGGAGHSSSGSSSSGSSGSSYSGGGSSGGSSSSGSGAEYRHPRAGTGTGNRYYYGGGYHGGGYYPGYSPWYPWYYPSGYAWGPYWGSYYYGYWPYGAYYGGGGYAPDYRSASGEAGAIRVLVDPEDAKVYVDGYYAGKVDDFDGFNQRLYLARGPHEILLKHDGYKSQRVRVYVVPGETLKIDHEMAKGQGEEALLDLSGGRGEMEERYAPEPRGPAREDRDDEAEVAPRPSPERDDGGFATRGALELTVRPSDASVYVDGEFRGTGRQLRTIEMAPGVHRVEVVRPGFPTFQREVEIRAGRTESLQAVLDRP